MANYQDYAKQESIDEELAQAGAAAEQRKEVPDSVRQRFDGKTVDDVLAAFGQLESRLGSQGQEVGELRRQNQMLMEMQMQAPAPQQVDTAEPVAPITVDDIYENPAEAIGRVVESKTKQQLEKIERQLNDANLARAKAELSLKFDGWENEVRAPEFTTWVTENAFRSRIAADADSGDLNAANDLLGEWYRLKESRGTQEQNTQLQRESQLDAAVLETSGPIGVQSEETYNRKELQDMRLAAKRGDYEAQQWLSDNAEDIRLAYEEERVI